MLTQLPSDVVVGHLVRYLCVRDMLAVRRVARSLRRLLQSPSDIRRALRAASMVRRRRVDISSYGGYVRRVDDEGHEWVLTTAGGTRQQWVRTPSPQVRMTPTCLTSHCWIDRRGMLWDATVMRQKAACRVGAAAAGEAPIVMHAANSTSVVALDALGQCWGRGRNLNRELGYFAAGDDDDEFAAVTTMTTTEFMMLHLPRRTVHVSVGDYHAAYTLCDGRVVFRGQDRGWGGWMCATTTQTRTMPGRDHAVEAAATTDGTLVRCRSGTLYLFGHLPHVVRTPTTEPVVVAAAVPPGQVVRRLVAGTSTVLLLTESGAVHGVGRGFPVPGTRVHVNGYVEDACLRRDQLVLTTRSHTYVGVLESEHLRHVHTARNPQER